MRIIQCIALAVLAAAPVMGATQTERAKPVHLRISSGVAEGLKRHDVFPEYPREALEKHIQGDVILGITIDTKGEVASIKLLRGDPILAEAAVAAVKKWKYRPYLLNGESAVVDTTVKVRFQM